MLTFLIRGTKVIGKVKVCMRAKWPVSAGAYPSLKPLGVFLLPLDGMLVYCSIKFADTHLYTWVVDRTTMRVKCLIQERKFSKL